MTNQPSATRSGMLNGMAHAALLRRARQLCRGAAMDLTIKEPAMPQTITTGYKGLLEAAEREIETLDVEDAAALYGRLDVVFVDIRDPREQTREGKMPGAFSCTRGMLEFWIDPESPYHKPVFAEDKKFVFFCAGGWRSALAAQTAQRMGMKPVAHIRGGFGEWKKTGKPVELPEAKP